MPPEAATVEIFWSLLSVVGVIWTWWLWRDASKSLYYWEAEGVNGGVEIATRNNLRSSATRFIRQVIYLLIGLTALTLPQPRYENVEPEIVTLIIPALFIVAQIINISDGILSRRAREVAITREMARKERGPV